MKYSKILNEAVVLLVFLILSISNLSAIANNPIDSSIAINQMNKSSFESSQPSGTHYLQLSENFTNGTIPPIGGKYGDWTINSTGGLLWGNSAFHPKSQPYCANIERGSNIIKDLEGWLITPSLDFSEIKDLKIYLDFYFRGHYHLAYEKNFVDYNVKVSVDGGKKWDLVWNENHIKDDKYSRTWMRIKVDLTRYALNSSVMIGFQFVTNNPYQCGSQYLYLDEVYVYNETEEQLSCSTDGPYAWDILRQNDYIPEGVRFHGKIDLPHLPVQCSWHWYFGDGNDRTYYFTRHAIHNYENTGTYNITLTVIHLFKGLITEVNTTLVLFSGDPLGSWNVIVEPFSFGFKATIENLEDYNATSVEWKIEAEWPPNFPLRSKVTGNGTIDNLEPNIIKDIDGSSLFLKLGRIRIIITITPKNIAWTSRTYKAFKIGPLIIVGKEIM